MVPGRSNVDEFLGRIFELYKGNWGAISAVLLDINEASRLKWMRIVGLPMTPKDYRMKPNGVTNIGMLGLWIVTLMPKLPLGEVPKAESVEVAQRRPGKMKNIHQLIVNACIMIPNKKLSRVSHFHAMNFVSNVQRAAPLGRAGMDRRGCDSDGRTTQGRTSTRYRSARPLRCHQGDVLHNIDTVNSPARR